MLINVSKICIPNFWEKLLQIVVTAFISPFQKDRDQVRKIFEEDEFIEVFIDCPLKVCEDRDPKGLYKKAWKGEIHDFTGMDSPYEPPIKPELTINTEQYFWKTTFDFPIY